MVYHGHVQDGRIVLEGGVRLPEGLRVRVDVPGEQATSHGDGERSLHQRLQPLIGSLRDAPADLAQNHDHYLYGAPKPT